MAMASIPRPLLAFLLLIIFPLTIFAQNITSNLTAPIHNATFVNNTSNFNSSSLASLSNDASNPPAVSRKQALLEESDQQYLANRLNLRLTAPIGVLGALLILSGAPMAFWGSRNRWSSYFLTGAYLASAIVMIPILRFGVIEQDHRPTIVVQALFLVAAVISAVLAGAVAVIFWKGTRFLVGASGGFMISIFILSLKSNVLIEAVGFRWIFITLATALGFILTTVPQFMIMTSLFSTAIVGSCVLVLGIDCFTLGGLKEFWLFILGFGSLFDQSLTSKFPLSVTMQAELGVMAGVFLMGAAVQWRLLEVIRRKVNQLKQMDRDREMAEEAAAYRQSMALDADLSRWEKRYGEDGYDEEADTPTVMGSLCRVESPRLMGKSLPSPSQPMTHRPSQSLSAINGPDPRESSPVAALYQSVSGRASIERLPKLDTGLGLSGALGLAQQEPGDGPHGASALVPSSGDKRENVNGKSQTLEQVHKMRPSVEKVGTEQAGASKNVSSPPAATAIMATASNSPQLPLSARHSQPHHSSHPLAAVSGDLLSVKIDFDKVEGDRRFSRPPGAPKSWTSSNMATSGPSLNLLSSNEMALSPMPAPSRRSSHNRYLTSPKRKLPESNDPGRSVSQPNILDQSREDRGLLGDTEVGPVIRHSSRPSDLARNRSERPLTSDSNRRASVDPGGLKAQSLGFRRQSAQLPNSMPQQALSGTVQVAQGGSRRLSKTFIDLSEPIDRMGRPLPLQGLGKGSRSGDARQPPNRWSRSGGALNSPLQPHPSSPPLSPHPPPGHRPSSSYHRLSQVMPIDELQQRHRHAMKKLQQPVNYNMKL